MILFSRGVHFATPEVRAWLSLDHIRLFLPELIKSIVSPGQAALRETPKNGLRLTALPGQTGFGGETEAGQEAKSNNSGAHDHRRFRPRPSPMRSRAIWSHNGSPSLPEALCAPLVSASGASNMIPKSCRLFEAIKALALLMGSSNRQGLAQNLRVGACQTRKSRSTLSGHV